MWLSPWDNFFRGGDHLAQGLWSLAGGALTGTGLGLGAAASACPRSTPTWCSRRSASSSASSACSRSWRLYALLVWRGFRAAFRAGGTYGFFLALGLTRADRVQILLIAGGVLGVLPLSGVVSPFLSSGRTAMLANFLILGLILGISARPGGERASAPATPPLPAARPAGPPWRSAWCSPRSSSSAARCRSSRPTAFLTRGALTLQGDGYRRFQYNPRLADIAQSDPPRRRSSTATACCSPPAIRPQLEKHRAAAGAAGRHPAGGG